MHGNVWEWVADCWHDSYKGAPNDGSAWINDNCRRSVLRGGSWGSSIKRMTAFSRGANKQSNRNAHFGFRIAHSRP